MAPVGTKHYAAVLRLDHLLRAAVAGRAQVAVRSPLQLDEHNEPEPNRVCC